MQFLDPRQSGGTGQFARRCPHAAPTGAALAVTGCTPHTTHTLAHAGPRKWRARGYALAMVALSLGTTLLMVKISYAQRNFSTALSEKDRAGFYAAVRQFVGIIVFAAPFLALNSWVEERVILAWRTYLTGERRDGGGGRQVNGNLTGSLERVDCSLVSLFVYPK